jgi:nitrogen PTS system EIIA component
MEVFDIIQSSSLFLVYGVKKAVFSSLDASDKASAVRSMVRITMERMGFTRNDIEGMANATLGREEIGSTGIGGGVAVPHTRHPCVSEIHVGWFLADPPIDFEALDGEPVDLFCWLVSPPNKPGDHLRMLEVISSHIKDEQFVSIARSRGIGHLEEYLSFYHKAVVALAAEEELATVGLGMNHLAKEKARFRSVAAEARWSRCQAEMARVEAVLDHLQARLTRLGAVAAKEGCRRLADMRGRLKEWVADAKKGQIMSAIWDAARGHLSSFDVKVSGQDVSIRVKAITITQKREEQHEDLRRTIESLPCLNGYCTEIVIEVTAEDEVAAEEKRRLEAAERSRLERAIRLDNLAGLLEAQGRPGEAEPLLRRALAIFETTLGPEHPRTVTCRANLAMLLSRPG